MQRVAAARSVNMTDVKLIAGGSVPGACCGPAIGQKSTDHWISVKR